MLTTLKKYLNQHLNAEDLKILEAIRNAPQSLRVEGRGTVMMDAKDIASTPEFKADLERAAKLVRNQ